MPVLNTLIETIQQHGCSPFFFTCAIQSGAFGEIGRKHQSELMDNNMEFRERMQSLREEFQRERLDEQLRFRRESYELSKQYLIQQTVAFNESRQKQIEFNDFIEKYWPLTTQVYTLLKEQEDILGKSSIVPLRVLIAKTDVSSYVKTSPISSYDEFCENVADGLRNLPNTVIESRPWKNTCQSMMCEAIDINYIMQGIPTLLVFPYQVGDTFGIEMAAWSFLRGFHSMTQNKILKMGGMKATEHIPDVVSAVKAVVGMARDAYMLYEYHSPVIFNKLVDEKTLELPAVKAMLDKHYKDLSQQIHNPKFAKLCTSNEMHEIENSLRDTKLLTV